MQIIKQPGLGECPVTVGRGHRQFQCFRGLVDGQARKIAQFHDFGFLRMRLCQSIQSLVNTQDFVGRASHDNRIFDLPTARRIPTPLLAFLAAGMVH